jgi:hypothetical protein
VVVDHVHHHPQAHLVERLHHLAELDHARHAVRVGAVAAFRHGVVEGVVAPVEAVQVGDALISGLLLLRIGRVGRQHSRVRRLPFGLVLVDGGDIKGWQQVQVGQPGLRPALEMVGAVGIFQGEGLEGAFQFSGTLRVVALKSRTCIS